jgi:hypothetical protein
MHTKQGNNLIAPIIIIVLGLTAWLLGNAIGDRQGGTNIGLTLIGIGGGLAKQENYAKTEHITSENIETINLENNQSKP